MTVESDLSTENIAYQRALLVVGVDLAGVGTGEDALVVNPERAIDMGDLDPVER